MSYIFSQAQVDHYVNDGYLIVRNFISSKEIAKLQHVALEDDMIKKNSYDLSDQAGKKTKLALWFTPGTDIYGILTRSERMVNAVDKLMEGNSKVCHFHSKLMQKEPRVGGAWEWHQDFGYWYKNEFLYPNEMMSVMIAITTASKENGCLQVIKGSHKMGRVEHGFAGDQVGASQRCVDLALKTMDLVYVELNPGDALFFHSNIIHRSEANLSDDARWSLISCYNRASNIPYNEKTTSCITPIDVVSDTMLLETSLTGITVDANFLDKDKDASLK